MRFRVFVPGGLASCHDLAVLCRAVPGWLGISDRQEWTSEVPDSLWPLARTALAETRLPWALAGIPAWNVVSSAPALGLTPTTPWLTEDSFREALAGFAPSPRLRVGVADPVQGLVPRWCHDLNFTAAESPERWRLSVRLAGALHPWPVLWGTEELARAAFLLEDELVALENRDPDFLEEALARRFPGSRPLDRQRPEPPNPRLPVHEGLHRLGDGTYSLGLWRPDGRFPSDLLADIAALCRATGIGFVGLTPWQSMLVKGIAEKDRTQWEQLLSRYGVNTRHAAQEGGWRPCEGADRKVQRRVVRRLVQKDVRTFGLTFSLHGGSTSVAIERQGLGWLIRRAEVPCAEALALGPAVKAWPWNLGRRVEAVCRSFANEAPALPLPAASDSLLPRCPDCSSVYDERWGDPLGGVAPGTPFHGLPESWTCPVCEASGQRFQISLKE
jgi:rubredoxin